MKKIYISIPITGQENISRMRAADFKKFLQQQLPDCEVMTPFDVCPEADKPYSYYLSKDIAYLMECDYVVFMTGWENSRGCRVEHNIVETYGISKRYQMAMEYHYKRDEPLL